MEAPALHAVAYHYAGIRCHTEILHQWLTNKVSSPTWWDLIKALRNRSVGAIMLADEIEKKYCPEGGEQITGPAKGEVCRNDLWLTTYV